MDITGPNLITIKGIQHHDTVLDRLWILVQSRQKVDFGLAGSGRLLRAHQLILGLFFQPEQLLDIGPQHWQGSCLDLLLEFVYRGTVSVPEEQLDTLLELAKQLDFTMLVDALLSAKNSIQVAKPSTQWPGVKIEDASSVENDVVTSLDESTIQQSTIINSWNSIEVVDHARNSWEPVLPKIEVGSEEHRRITDEEPLTSNQLEPEWHQAVESDEQADEETEWNSHNFVNSIPIEADNRSEVTPAGDWLDVTGSSNRAERNKTKHTAQLNSESRDKVFEYRYRQSELKNDRRSTRSQFGSANQTEGGVDVTCLLITNQRVAGVSNPIGSVGLTAATTTRNANTKLSKALEVELRRCKGNRSEKSSNTNARGSNSDTMSGKLSENVGNLTGSGTPKDVAKDFECPACGKVFTTRNTLAVHCRIHTGVKPYSCQVCSMRFVLLSQLRSHARVHTGERPFRCKVCHMTFAHSSSKTRHFRLHTGERPYKCQFCPKAFTNAGNLTAHTRIHKIPG